MKVYYYVNMMNRRQAASRRIYNMHFNRAEIILFYVCLWGHSAIWNVISTIITINEMLFCRINLFSKQK